MKTNSIIILMSLIVSITSIAQNPNIQIGYSNEWPNEPSICMSPVNPDEIIIGSVLDNYYTSTDGGLSWQYGVITSSYGVNGDPVILADNSGNFYYFHLVSDLSRVVCHKKNGIQSPWSDESYMST